MPSKKTKIQIVRSIAEEKGFSVTQTSEIVDAFVEDIRNTLKAGDSVALSGFGVFSVVDVPARKARNPITNEPVDVPACRRAKFKASAVLKREL